MAASSSTEPTQAMQQLAGVPPAKRTNAESVPRDHQGKNHDYLLNEATQRSDEVLRRVCHLYEADYACFGYDRPDACTPAHLRGEEAVHGFAYWLA